MIEILNWIAMHWLGVLVFGLVFGMLLFDGIIEIIKAAKKGDKK